MQETSKEDNEYIMLLKIAAIANSLERTSKLKMLTIHLESSSLLSRRLILIQFKNRFKIEKFKLEIYIRKF